MFRPPIVAIFRDEFFQIYITKNNKPQFTNTKYYDTIHTALEHPSLTQFSTNNFISILYFNIFLYLKLNILYFKIGFDVLCNISFEKHVPKNDHNRWLMTSIV
jgi:hypothetical protein